MDFRDADDIIREVKKRPALYDGTVREYGDKILKESLWNEVCEAVCDDWDELSPDQKLEKCRVVQRRWRSLRDCFRRDLKDGGRNEKKKYIYFDKLLFLMPFYEKPDVSVMEVSVKDRNKDSVTQKPTATEGRKSSTRPRRDYEEQLLEVLKRRKDDDIDEDKSFFTVFGSRF